MRTEAGGRAAEATPTGVCARRTWSDIARVRVAVPRTKVVLKALVTRENAALRMPYGSNAALTILRRRLAPALRQAGTMSTAQITGWYVARA